MMQYNLLEYKQKQTNVSVMDLSLAKRKQMHCGISVNFFCSYDLDLDPITKVLKQSKNYADVSRGKT